MGRTKPRVSSEYVVGLTDGEGCFYVNVGESPRYRSGVKIQEKDHQLLEKVKNTIGCGAVYFQKEQRANHAQCYRYTVSAQSDIINIIIPFFKQHPLQSYSKNYSFRVFCKIAQLVKSKAHFSKAGISKIRILKSKMNQKTLGLA